MLSVLVGHSYFLRLDPKQFERAKPYPPLATLQVAALARQAGHQVALFDAMLAEGVESFRLQLEHQRPQLLLLYEDNFNYLSKMCLGAMRAAACEMIGHAVRAGVRVIAAGSDVSDAPAVYLQAGADVVLSGEGLAPLQQLLTRLDGALGLSNASWAAGLSGAGTLVDGRPEFAEPPADAASGTVVSIRKAAGQAEPVPDVSQTAWDLVDIDRYRSVWQSAHGRFSLNIAASKGCSFRCSWCAKPIWGQRYQQRSPEAVAAEVAWLERNFAPDQLWFADDIFGFKADWVSRFAEQLQAAGAHVPFSIQTRADLVSPAMAEALAKAGCQEAWIGAESGSQRILDAMHKGTTVEEILQARARLKDQGIRVGLFIQLGYLDEQLDDLLDTRRLIEQAQPDAIGVSVAYPLPGTPFFEQVKAQLGDKTRWEDSGELAMMFRGTYSSAFYRRFRDLLHQQVEGGPDRAELSGRWQALIAEERQYRNEVQAA